jgi:hypothetical protein
MTSLEELGEQGGCGGEGCLPVLHRLRESGSDRAGEGWR